MPTLQFAGISLTAPDSYTDRSVYVIAATSSPGPFQRNLTLVFDALGGRDLSQLQREVEQQVLQLRQPGLRLGAKSRLRVGGRDAASVEYATDDAGPAGSIRLVRRIVLVPVEPRLLIATFTATESDFAMYAAELDAILASIQL